MDAEGIDKALLACWSLGVNIGFELARQYPDRVAGILAVAGVPGGTFQSIGGRLKVPKPLRYGLGASGARGASGFGKQVTWTAQHIPLNRFTATVINHTAWCCRPPEARVADPAAGGVPRARLPVVLQRSLSPAPSTSRWTWRSLPCP